MMSRPIRQADLFPTTASVAEPPVFDPKRMEAAVRPRLSRLLAEARAASRMPWDEQRVGVHAELFHNMANWLPAAERDALRAAFEKELERLRAAD